MTNDNKDCPTMNHKITNNLKDGEKIVIRLSTRNPALNIATRKHYEGNDNVTFVYQEEETLSLTRYWEKLAERAKILDQNDSQQTSFSSSSLIPKSKDFNNLCLSLNDKEEDSFYANIEREWKIKKEREKLKKEKQADIDRRITEFQIEIQRRLAHDDEIIMSTERKQYPQTTRSETDESLIILSDTEYNQVYSSHNNETIESSEDYSSNEDLLVESVHCENEKFHGTNENNSEHDLKQMVQRDRSIVLIEEDQSSVDLSTELSASQAVDSEEHSSIDLSFFSNQALVEQMSHSQTQTNLKNDRDSIDMNESKDTHNVGDEERETPERGLQEFDKQNLGDIVCTSPYSIYKDYYDERNSSDQCSDFNRNEISFVESCGSAGNENISVLSKEEAYHSAENSFMANEHLQAVANNCLSNTYEPMSTKEYGADSFESIDDLATYHDANIEDGFKTDQSFSTADGESDTEKAIKIEDHVRYANNTQSSLSLLEIGTGTATSNLSESETNLERGEEEFDSDFISHESQANELEMSDVEFYDCNVSFNVSLSKHAETPQSKSAFKEMSPFPPATPQSPLINSILDELLDASLSAYEKKSIGMESTAIDVEATNLISKTLNVVGDIDGALLKHLTEDAEVFSHEDHHLEEELEHITVKEDSTDLNENSFEANITKQGTEPDLNETGNFSHYGEKPFNLATDFANEQSRNKRKFSDIGLQDLAGSTKQSNSFFKRAKRSFLNIFPLVSIKDMYRRPTKKVQNFDAGHGTKTLVESQEDENLPNGKLSEVLSSINLPKPKDFDQLGNKSIKNLGNLVEAVSEFTNTSLISFESDTDSDVQKDESLVIVESSSETENIDSKEDTAKKQQNTFKTEGIQNVFNEKISNKETEEESSANIIKREKTAPDQNDLLFYEAERDETKYSQNEAKEVVDREIENEEVEAEIVKQEFVNNGVADREEVDEEIENEEIENEEIENEEIVNEEIVNEEIVNEEIENEEIENGAVKDQGEKHSPDQRSTNGPTNDQGVSCGAQNEVAREYGKEVNQSRGAVKITSDTLLGHTLSSFCFRHHTETNSQSGQDLCGSSSTKTHAPFKNVDSNVEAQTLEKTEINETIQDNGNERAHTFTATATMDKLLSDSDVSYIDAEILQLGDDDIHILPLNYHHAPESSVISQPPTPLIEVKMEVTSSDQSNFADDNTDFIKVDESVNNKPDQITVNQDDISIINVIPSVECSGVDIQTEPEFSTVSGDFKTSDCKASELKLSAPPVAVRTRSRSPSRRSETSKSLLNTEKISKIDLSYKANRVISYGSDEDPIELNPTLPRIYPEMVEEADNFIENDLERHESNESLKFVSSDAEEESRQKIVVKKRLPKKKKILEEIKVGDTVDPSLATFEERLQVNSSTWKDKSNTGKVSKKKYHRRNAKSVRGKKRGRSSRGKRD